MRNLSARTRSAFTLIELLVVIAIIGILAALLIVAVSRVSDQGVAVQATSDIRNLTIAVNNFKAKYGVFPPSRVTLSDKSSNMDATSLAYITAIWPRIDFSNASGLIDWTGTGQKGTFTLTGDQCLVFFLGGIPDSIVPNLERGGRRGCRGFSSNPQNPTNLGIGTVESFYQFDNSRLILPHLEIRRPSDNLSGGYFYSYADPYDFHIMPPNPHFVQPDSDNRIPYAYFSSNKRKNGYNSSSDCPSLIGNGPYVESINPLRYYNPTTFQIISAGKNGVFGPGGYLVINGTSIPWSPANATLIGPAGADDQSNFYDAQMGVAQ